MAYRLRRGKCRWSDGIISPVLGCQLERTRSSRNALCEVVGRVGLGRVGLFSTTVFLSGGILGAFHHLYFSGTPTAVLALGAVFSALEVVPLVLIGFEAYENLTLTRARPWVEAYRWPIYFFVAVAFWNLVGAGLYPEPSALASGRTAGGVGI